ncbi:MAG TPA: hypothetical protein VLE99_03080 [Candidatus Saccharimonadales bacterium]|nr:hypothetical protein [Candidatus Saccharimonadales bacterium]
MSRLPQPGGDDGLWGQILNDFLAQSLNVDGTLKLSAVPVQSVNGKTGAVTLTAGDVGAPTTLAALTDVTTAGVTDTQVLAYNQSSAKWLPATVSGAAVSDADSTTKGILKLTGDLGGTANSPTVPGLAAKATDTAVVHNTGNENIGGIKTFTSSPVVPSASFPESAVVNLTTDLAAKAVDTAVVHNTGAESINGVKSFVSSPVVPAPSGNTAAVNKSYVDTAISGIVSGVSSVNTQVGAVTLTAANVGADASGAAATAQTNAEGYTDTQIATSPGFISYDTVNSIYPNRSTATSSGTRVVIWIGPVAPSVGGNGAIDGLDVWWRTP